MTDRGIRGAGAMPGRKPIRLAVHRNTADRRAARELRNAMVRAARDIGGRRPVAYAIVVIDEAGAAHAAWDTGGAMPMWAWPEVVGQILRQDMGRSGVEDDWRPPVRRHPPRGDGGGAEQ